MESSALLVPRHLIYRQISPFLTERGQERVMCVEWYFSVLHV